MTDEKAGPRTVDSPSLIREAALAACTAAHIACQAADLTRTRTLMAALRAGATAEECRAAIGLPRMPEADEAVIDRAVYRHATGREQS